MNVLMVGMALDTNGQKARFVEAARKWGRDPDVVRALIAGHEDLAGVAARYAAASADAPGLAIRSAHKAAAYFDFPYDIKWSRRTEAEVRQLADEADLIHLTNDVRAYFWLRQARAKKPGLIHHHGTLFRSQHARLLTEARRLHLVQAVSTIDLKRFAPDELHWLPTCYDLDALAAIREQYRRPEDGRVRIVSAPTNREVKSTDTLERAVRQLQTEGLLLDLVLVEGKTWAECLEVKATADIYFDQVKLGYGCNAIEAWGMGIPVVAGADDWTLGAMVEEWGALPFIQASEDTMVDVLRKLVVSKTQRERWAKTGAEHAAKYHAEKPALTRLAELYALALNMRREAPITPDTPDEFPLTPGTFTTTRSRTVFRVGNQDYRLTEDAPLRVDHARQAQRIRGIARNRPELGIVEVFA